jgi:ligand-binding sensor domain-containing protein
MRHKLIVPPFAALSLIATAIAFSARAAGAFTVAGPSPRPRPQTALPSDSPTASAAAPFKVAAKLDKAILHIFQDSKGVYWCGSHGQGVYRRDETAFAHFTADSGLCDNQIVRIQEDKLGNLHFTTPKGTSKFDGQRLTTLKVDDSDPSSTVWKLEPDDLWFPGGQDSNVVYRYDGNSLRKLTFPTTAAGDAHYAMYPRSKYPNMKYSPYDVYTVYKDSRGAVWFGTSNLGACRYDGKTFAWISETELGFAEKNNRNFGTRSLIEDRDGKFWITVTRHRFDMHPTGSATQSVGGPAYTKTAGLAHAAEGVDEDYTYIMSMAKDKAGDLWMATYGAGVWRYDGKALTSYPVLVDGKPITLFSIYSDREDGLWLGTHEHGVCKFNGKAFEKVKF